MSSPETTLCSCVTCPECRGSGTVWFAIGGTRYLGAQRCDDCDEMECCEECGGSGIFDICDNCQREFEEFNDDNQP